MLSASGQVDRAPMLDTVDPSYVLVAAHRCGYMSNGTVILPENSIAAMNYSVGLGVDILETDIRMTLDGELVLMHDTTVDRTTTGSGSVSSLTLAQIRELRLKGSGGVTTNEQVPTLEEIMLFAKANGLLVSLDKYSITTIAVRDEIMAVLIATDTVDRAILKGYDSAADVAAMRAAYPDHAFHYMPTLSNKSEATTIAALNDHSPSAIELIFSDENTPMLSANSVAAATNVDSHIWINSLWSSLCAGHTDGVALGGDPDGSWGWIIDKGATMIDTDNPAQLIPYLYAGGLHGTNPPPSTTIFFRDTFSALGSGTGWVAGSDWGAGTIVDQQYKSGGQHFRNFATIIPPTDGTEFWVSMEMTFLSSAWGGLSFYNGGTEVLLFGRDTGHGAIWGIDGNGVTDTYTSVPIVTGQTYFILGRCQYIAGDDQVSLWVDPANASSLAALGTPDATTSDSNLGQYSQVRLGTASDGLVVDNLIIATTLVEVMRALGSLIIIQ